MEPLLIPAAERTLRLVELLLSRSEGYTPQELLEQLDLSRSSLYVLLRTLKTLGYVEQAGKRGPYLPGARLKAWRTSDSPTPQDLLVAFYQEATARPLTETLALALPTTTASRDHFLIVAQVEGSSLVRSAFSIGQTYSDLPAVADLMLNAPSHKIIEAGFGIQQRSEAFTVALPICRDGIHAEAALLLTAPAFRWSSESLIVSFLDDLRNMAAHLSYRLGAPFYAPFRLSDLPSLQGTLALSAAEIGAFLQGPWAASLACVRPDGRPHVIPVWQEWDGSAFSVIAWRGSQWAEYVQLNPHVSLTVDEPWSPLRRVVLQGCAQSLNDDPPHMHALIQRLAQRYLGQAAPAGLVNQVQRAFRIQPDSLRGWRGLPGKILNP